MASLNEVNADEAKSPGTPTPSKVTRKRSAAKQSSTPKLPEDKSSITPKRPRTQERVSKQPSSSQTLSDPVTPTPTKRAAKGTLKKATRKTAGSAISQRLSRAHTERMIIIDHAIVEDTGNGAQISFDIVGSVGNIYKVWIKASPSCTCPDHMYRRNRCKHIAYVMLNALSGTDEQIAQRFFYREDLNHMRGSPALKRFEAAKAAQNPQGTRRPVEGECAICFMGMEETEEIAWCQYGCGNNLHGFCMNKWSKSSGGNVRCVYCRALWDAEKKNPQADAIRNAGVRRGMYVNVAEQFGMTSSSERKVSPGKLRATGSREADSNEELDGDAM